MEKTRLAVAPLAKLVRITVETSPDAGALSAFN